MKLGILHLSDLHFVNESNNIAERVEMLSNRVSCELHTVDKLVVAISGDLTNSGHPSEFNQVKLFCDEFASEVKEKSDTDVFYTFSPGNHDNDLSADVVERKKCVESILGGKDITECDIECCCSVQSGFRSFAVQHTFGSVLTQNALVYANMLEVGTHKQANVVFICLNTAWLSLRHEQPSQIRFMNNLIEDIQLPQNSIVVCLLHHPLNWLNPNDMLFQEIRDELKQKCHVILTGHEHFSNARREDNLLKQHTTILFQASNRSIDCKGFNFMIIDVAEEELSYQIYPDKEDMYTSPVSDKWRIPVRYNMQITAEHSTFLDRIDIPLAHPIVDEVDLPSIFVEPDVEILDRADPIRKYPSFFDFVCNSDQKKVFIIGEGQSGKTSNLKALYRHLYTHNSLPIFMSGKSITTTNFLKLSSSRIKKEYIKLPWEQYLFLNRDERVLLIDDFDQSSLSVPDKIKFIEAALGVFGKIVISMREYELYMGDDASNELIWANSDVAQILPLGHKKKDKLIHKWVYLGKSEEDDEETRIRKLQNLSEAVIEVVKTKIRPYPFTILAVLQNAVAGQPDPYQVNVEYSDCYEMLVKCALKRVVGPQLSNSYANMLSFFAYAIYSGQLLDVTVDRFRSFYKNYSEMFAAPHSEINQVLNTLQKSRLIRITDGVIQFTQPYFYHYYLAKYIARFHNREDVKNIVRKMYRNIHVLRNANVIIFLSHMLNDDSCLWEEFLENLSALFPMYDEETLDADSVSFMNQFYDILPELTLDEKENVTSRREKMLEQKDQLERALPDPYRDEDDIDDIEDLDSFPYQIMHLLRFTDVTGHILKSKFGSLEIDRLRKFIKYTIQANLRLLRWFTHNNKPITNTIKPLLKEYWEANQAGSIGEAEDFAKALLFRLFNNIILGTLFRAAANTGSSHLVAQVSKICGENTSPAYKMIELMVRMEYGYELPIKELSELKKQYHANTYVVHALGNIVHRHLYLHNVDYKDQQRLAELFNIQMKNQRHMQRNSSIRQLQ